MKINWAKSAVLHPLIHHPSTFSDKSEHFVQTVDHEIRIVDRNAHRWFDAQRVAVQAALADDEPPIAGELHHFGRFGFGGRFGFAIRDQFDTEHQPESPHIADQLVLLLQLFASRLSNDCRP